MLYGHAIDALLAPVYKAGAWHTAWQFQRGLTSSLFLLLAGFAFSVATGRHWTSHTTLTAKWWKRVRRFAFFVGLGYMLHFPAGSVFDLPWVREPQWRSFFAADVLQLIGVTFIGVQCLVLLVPSRRRFALMALTLAVAIVAATPFMWATDWSRWLPIGVWAYLAPVFGPEFPLFPLFPWSAFILIGVALGQLYARWGGAHLSDFTRRALILPGAVIVAAAYGVAMYPHEIFTGGARSLLPVDMAIRVGSCLLILGAIAMASGHLTRLPHVFSAIAQETLLIYFIHLCVIYGSAWSFGLVHAFGARLDPWGMLGIVVGLIAAMAAVAAWWNWLKHARPLAARWVARVAMAVLVSGFIF
jgi:uncharacterized membrane protein